MTRNLSESERRAEEAKKERRRDRLRGQIQGVQNQINSYNNEISSLESKLALQRAMKALFDEKCSDLDTEKAAKAVGEQNAAQYIANLNYALGYAEVMNDLLSGNTGQVYQNYQQEIAQFMQMEINENQARFEELQRERNNSTAVIADLNNQLAKI